MKSRFSILCLLVNILLISCEQAPQYYEVSGRLHTPYHIKFEHTKPLDKEIDEQLKYFYHLFNAFDSTSVISQVNQNRDIRVDTLFQKVFKKALEVSAETNGAYDVTCAPLINLWGFGFSRKDSVTPAHIDSVRQFIGSQKVRLEGDRIVKDDPRLMMNFSSLADGTVCDMIAQMLEKKGVRNYLEESLDEIFATEYKWMKDCIEAKLFGIGLESYTVGSYDFYLGYGAKKNKIVTLDTGHFHLTESIADKVSSLLLFTPEIMLHVSRPIRWDSDHVVILNDDVQDLAREIVRCDALDRVHIGLDYFDATINRIGAYVIGSRATQKAFMLALLEPIALLRQYEDEGKYFQRLALQEEAKSLPWGAVWDMYCLQSGVPVGESYIAEIEKYESDVTSRRQ